MLSIEELHNLYASPNIFRVIKSRRMRWHAWKRREMNTKFWSESLKGRGNFEDPGLNEKIILKWVLRK
jgi:hypothetical protein